MKLGSRLSSALHLLLHMAETDEPTTSEVLSRYLATHPVVVRRAMAGLREAGIVRSGKGHGGGWTLARALGAITLLEVYRALGAPALFALGNREEKPRCLVEQAVNASLDDAFREAEALLVERLGEITLADIAADFRVRMKNHQSVCGEKHDAA